MPTSGKQPENFSTLNQHFAAILAVADSADAAPTTQATAAYQDLEQSETDLRRRWSAIRERDIPDLNKGLTKAGLTSIDPEQATRRGTWAEHRTETTNRKIRNSVKPSAIPERRQYVCVSPVGRRHSPMSYAYSPNGHLRCFCGGLRSSQTKEVLMSHYAPHRKTI